ETAPEDAALQDDVWGRVWRLRGAHAGAVTERLLFGNELAHRCDTPAAVASLLRLLADEPSDRGRYLWYLRLQELARARRLGGGQAPRGAAAPAGLQRDARRATGMVGHYSTDPFDAKKLAWESLLSLGLDEPVASLDAFLEGERNGFALNELLSLAA